MSNRAATTVNFAVSTAADDLPSPPLGWQWAGPTAPWGPRVLVEDPAYVGTRGPRPTDPARSFFYG